MTYVRYSFFSKITSFIINCPFISILLFCFFNYGGSVKILYHYSIGCKSTSSFHETITKILINHGYEIIAICPYPTENQSNYTDIGVHNSFLKFSDAFSVTDNVVGTYINMKLSYESQIINCENIYQNDKIHHLLKDMKVDLVIFEVDSADCFLPLVTQFRVPIIGIGTSTFLNAEFDGLMGNVVNPALIPTTMSGFSTKMNFFQRLENMKNYMLHWLVRSYYVYQSNNMVKKYIKSPPIEELYDQISLVFCNSHFSFVPRSVAPNVVNIAGIHLGNTVPLPGEIQNFITDANQSIIYVSLGSVAKFSELPQQIHDGFVNVLKNQPYRILWRHDKPEMVGNISSNILAQEWFPQKDILAQKNTILFISHSGTFSTYEAMHFGIPILSFPLCFDQFTNAAIVENLEIGLSLDLRDFDENSLRFHIDEIIRNTKYRKKMETISTIFRDRPQNPKDTFIYWVEYILRHRNVSFLKPLGSKLPFYQYLLLDVIFFSILTVILFIWIMRVIIKLLLRLID